MCASVYFSVEIGENCLIYNNTFSCTNLQMEKLLNLSRKNQISTNKFIIMNNNLKSVSIITAIQK